MLFHFLEHQKIVSSNYIIKKGKDPEVTSNLRVFPFRTSCHIQNQSGLKNSLGLTVNPSREIKHASSYIPGSSASDSKSKILCVSISIRSASACGETPFFNRASLICCPNVAICNFSSFWS